MSIEQQTPMVIVEVPKDSTGTVLVVSLVDLDGVAPDLSAATGPVLYSGKTVDDVAVASDVAAAWFTDGSDGKVSITLTAALVGTVRDVFLDIDVQGYSGGSLISFTFVLRTLPRAKVV